MALDLCLLEIDLCIRIWLESPKFIGLSKNKIPAVRDAKATVFQGSIKWQQIAWIYVAGTDCTLRFVLCSTPCTEVNRSKGYMPKPETRVATTWHGHTDTQNSDTTRHGTYRHDRYWHATTRNIWNMTRQKIGTKFLNIFCTHVPTSWGHVKKI